MWLVWKGFIQFVNRIRMVERKDKPLARGDKGRIIEEKCNCPYLVVVCSHIKSTQKIRSENVELKDALSDLLTKACRLYSLTIKQNVLLLKQMGHVLQFSLYLLRDCYKKIPGVLYLVQCLQTLLERNCHNFTSVVSNCKSKFRMTKHVMLCFLQSRDKFVLKTVISPQWLF